jgi:hypothetical protein
VGGSGVNTANGGSYLRNALGTIVRGFLLGVGLSVALGATYLVVFQITMNKTEAALEGKMGDFGQSSAKDFALSDVEELKHDGVTSIIGSVKNSGKTTGRSVQIQANLFNHGRFVDQYSTYISGAIAPGESRNFKIACGCNAPPAEHDSFKLEVIP